MKCKYCGKDVRPVGPNLESDDNGYNCPASVSKKHAIIPDVRLLLQEDMQYSKLQYQ